VSVAGGIPHLRFVELRPNCIFGVDDGGAPVCRLDGQPGVVAVYCSPSRGSCKFSKKSLDTKGNTFNVYAPDGVVVTKMRYGQTNLIPYNNKQQQVAVLIGFPNNAALAVSPSITEQMMEIQFTIDRDGESIEYLPPVLGCLNCKVSRQYDLSVEGLSPHKGRSATRRPKTAISQQPVHLRLPSGDHYMTLFAVPPVVVSRKSEGHYTFTDNTSGRQLLSTEFAKINIVSADKSIQLRLENFSTDDQYFETYFLNTSGGVAPVYIRPKCTIYFDENLNRMVCKNDDESLFSQKLWCGRRSGCSADNASSDFSIGTRYWPQLMSFDRPLAGAITPPTYRAICHEEGVLLIDYSTTAVFSFPFRGKEFSIAICVRCEKVPVYAVTLGPTVINFERMEGFLDNKTAFSTTYLSSLTLPNIHIPYDSHPTLYTRIAFFTTTGHWRQKDEAEFRRDLLKGSIQFAPCE